MSKVNKEQEELEKEHTVEEKENQEKVAEVEDNTEEQEENSELEADNTLEIELAEAKDKYLRLYSEFENFRRRTAREKSDLISSASRKVIEELLPVLDDFERAMKAKEDNGEEEDKGVELIYNKFKKVLEANGLKKMEIAQGDDFDDEYHEAITQIPAPEENLEGKIVDVVEPGYFLNEKVIRFAKVVTGAKG